MPDDDLAFAPTWELRELIDSKQVSSVELTEMFLRRIEALNPKLNAYLTVTDELARLSARDSDERLSRGKSLGYLDGISISIKDLEVTRGIRSTMGSAAFKDHVPEQDSIVVERIRNSGAVILGKTNTPEFGFSGTTDNLLGEECRNPWDPGRTSGGSSGGAGAAVASGLCTVATGSDGGGSIRIPCSFNGIFGIKPTQGRVPRFGGVGRPAFSAISQPGPMTRTVRDSALLLQMLAGPDDRDPGCLRESPPDFVGDLEQGVRGLRVAWSPDLGYAAVDPEVLEAASRSARLFEELGCSVEEPGITLDEPLSYFWDLFSSTGYAAYGHLLDEQPDQLTEYGRETFEHGRGLTAADYSRVLYRVQQLRGQMEIFFEHYDLLMTPTLAVPAFPVGQRPGVIGGQEVVPFWGYTPFTFPFNMTMQPAASVPCGFSSEGLPIGLHIIGRRGEEATVLRASAAFEQARPWAESRPAVA